MSDLDTAIILYAGWKSSSYPLEDEARVLDHFGQAKGTRILEDLNVLLDELDGLKPIQSDGDSNNATKRVMAEFTSRHPNLHKETIEVLQWYYSWWWR